MQFEKEDKGGDDPFNVAELISDVEKGASGKRYGIQDQDESRAAKRSRIDDDEA